MFARLRRKSSTRSQLEELVDRLELPENWSVEVFLAALERMRGRRIIRRPLPVNAPVGLCGLWLAREHDDVIVHRVSSDPIQERHVIAHEVAHMLLCHGRPASPAQVARMLMGVDAESELEPAVVRTARWANAYARHDEYEAELFATLIMTRPHRSGTTR
ncbi:MULTISPECIES: hypothetical protein [Nocardia]|uniref:hypothetical protein n=1 Tax=Nocardia TaxID=1817 RepID=UPI00245580B4|nr:MULTISPECIES: hypothetical protein [Nocardia]